MTDEWKPCYRFPEDTDEGIFKLTCSCKKWTFEGTAKETIEASRRHDDSPYRNHIVSVIGKKVE